jgi:hypothetical protein
MPPIGETVKPTLRMVLADSHISAVAIAVLLLRSLEWAFRALVGPLLRVAGALFYAVAILEIPDFSLTLDRRDRLILITTFSYFFGALSSVAAAWLISRGVYGVGPLHVLSGYRDRFEGRNHV